MIDVLLFSPLPTGRAWRWMCGFVIFFTAYGGLKMPRTRKPELTIGAACLALVASFFLVTARAQQPAVAIDGDDIGGVVTSANGPEAGGRGSAGTRALPVRYIKAVVTDDRGRFVVPDLPKANYAVWAR